MESNESIGSILSILSIRSMGVVPGCFSTACPQWWGPWWSKPSATPEAITDGDGSNDFDDFNDLNDFNDFNDFNDLNAFNGFNAAGSGLPRRSCRSIWDVGRFESVLS